MADVDRELKSQVPHLLRDSRTKVPASRSRCARGRIHRFLMTRMYIMMYIYHIPVSFVAEAKLDRILDGCSCVGHAQA